MKVFNERRKEFALCGLLFYCLISIGAVAGGCGLVAVFPIVKFLFAKKGLVDNKFHDKTAETHVD